MPKIQNQHSQIIATFIKCGLSWMQALFFQKNHLQGRSLYQLNAVTETQAAGDTCCHPTPVPGISGSSRLVRTQQAPHCEWGAFSFNHLHLSCVAQVIVTWQNQRGQSSNPFSFLWVRGTSESKDDKLDRSKRKYFNLCASQKHSTFHLSRNPTFQQKCLMCHFSYTHHLQSTHFRK